MRLPPTLPGNRRTDQQLRQERKRIAMVATVRFLMKFRTLHYQQLRQRKANSAMTDTSPTTVNRTLPTRLPNSAYRVREYLTEKEVERLIEAARKRGRNGPRDAAAIPRSRRPDHSSECCAVHRPQRGLLLGITSSPKLSRSWDH